MKKNMGTVDRVVRTVIAVILGILIVSGVIKGTPAIVLGIIAIAFLVTSIFARCPGYVPFGISTLKRHE
jgi:amino acid transporter